MTTKKKNVILCKEQLVIVGDFDIHEEVATVETNPPPNPSPRGHPFTRIMKIKGVSPS